MLLNDARNKIVKFKAFGKFERHCIFTYNAVDATEHVSMFHCFSLAHLLIFLQISASTGTSAAGEKDSEFFNHGKALSGFIPFHVGP
jgi:hypothetical protein